MFKSSQFFSFLTICSVCIFSNNLSSEHKEGEIIVRYTDDTTDFEKNKTAVKFKLTKIDSIKFNNSVLYQFDHNQSAGDLKKSLKRLNHIKYVSFNSIFRQLSFDPEFGNQWYLENTGQQVRWVLGTPGIDIGWKSAVNNLNPIEDVFVAVMDSGFAKDHVELKNGITLQSIAELNGIPGKDDDGNGYRDDIDGWDFVGDDPNPYDLNGHGTQVAGIIAGAVNGVGIQGISQNVGIKPLRVAGSDGIVNMWDVASAVLYISKRNNFRIINLSLSSLFKNPLLEEVLEELEEENEILVICAAGNGGNDGNGDNNDYFPRYPASYDYENIISVASIDQKGQLSNFSNFGLESVDLAAPGENIRVATVEREFKILREPDDSWREEFFRSSFEARWSTYTFGGFTFLASPPNSSFLHYAGVTSTFITLDGMKDPRVKIPLFFQLNGLARASLRIKTSKVNHRIDIFEGSLEKTQIYTYDISDYIDDEVRFVFEYHEDIFDPNGYFDIGGVYIDDVTTSSSLNPHYEFQKGTSFSAPIVSGVAAMIFSCRPDLLASDVKEILLNSVLELDSLSGKVKSGGMVRADKALELADTYRRRSSVEFVPSSNQQLTPDFNVKINDTYLTYKEMTAGVLDGQGDYFEGDSITLKAESGVGFNFEGWEESGEIISTDATYTFTSEFKDYVFKAIFTEDLSDPDNDEFPNYAEALYGTDIGNPNTDNDALNDYDEWQVGWYGSSLRLLEDDSETISLLEDILGKDSYKKGELAGIEKGETNVIADPSSFGLISKAVYDKALEDANVAAEHAIADARVSAIAEGENSVTFNPSAYNLVTKSAYEQMVDDMIKVQSANTTHYTEGWFYLPSRGWMWTNHSSYPYFYDSEDKDWMYFQSGEEKPRFYRYKTKSWLTIE